MSMLSHAEAYITERRKLGFALREQASRILSFARYADESGHQGPMTSDIVLRWAKDQAHRADPFTWATRVNSIRRFSRFLAERHPGTEFPEGAPFGRGTRRLAPHIYSEQEIAALVAAARRLPGRYSGTTYATLVSLLAATGLRIAEALRLRIDSLDLDAGRFVVRHSKFQRSRLVPLHQTGIDVMRAYLVVRARHGSMLPQDPLFLSETTGRALQYHRVSSVFRMIVADLGLVARGGHRAVRIHDLRHTFICQRMISWQAEGKDLGNAIRALSTYVGHVNIVATYWYIQSVPELMSIVGGLFEQRLVQSKEAIDA
jgi:integrase/recombinase XerD